MKNLIQNKAFPGKGGNSPSSKTIVILVVGLLMALLLSTYKTKTIYPTPSTVPEEAGTPSAQVLAVKTDVPVPYDNLVILINQTRRKNGLNTLIPNDQLNKSAQAKADDMCKQKYWSHDNPQGKTPWAFFNEAGYRYMRAGENLALGCSDMVCMVLWMNSPTHKDVLLDPKFKEIGIGRCGNYKVTHYGVR